MGQKKGGSSLTEVSYIKSSAILCDKPPTCNMLIAQGTLSMLVMVEMADQTALWCARGQRMMATRVRMFMYFTAKEKKCQNTSFPGHHAPI